MELRDLKQGMEIELRNKDKRTVKKYDGIDDILYFEDGYKFENVMSDLTHVFKDSLDIMIVKDTYGTIIFNRDNPVEFEGIKFGSQWECTTKNYAVNTKGKTLVIAEGEKVKVTGYSKITDTIIIQYFEGMKHFIPLGQFKACFEEVKEEKFYFYPKGIGFHSKKVMNFNLLEKEWYVDNMDENNRYQIQFTIEEFKELGLDPEHYDKIPVSEVE